MTPDDYGPFLIAVTTLAEAYQATISAPALRVYWVAVEDEPVTLADVKVACRAWVKTDTAFMPKPGELLAYARTAQQDRERASVADAILAPRTPAMMRAHWGRVGQAFQAAGVTGARVRRLLKVAGE